MTFYADTALNPYPIFGKEQAGGEHGAKISNGSAEELTAIACLRSDGLVPATPPARFLLAFGWMLCPCVISSLFAQTPPEQISSASTGQAERDAWGRERVARGLKETLRLLQEGRGTGGDLVWLWVFSESFPDQAREAGSQAYLEALAPGSAGDRAQGVLLRAFDEKTSVAAWLLALKEAEAENGQVAGAFASWASRHIAPSIEPGYWGRSHSAEGGEESSLDWELVTPEAVEMLPLSLSDLGQATTGMGFAFSSPGANLSTDAESLLAAAKEAGVFSAGKPSNRWPAALARLKSWNADYAAIFEVLTQWDRTAFPSGLEVELRLRQVSLGQGTPARLASRLLQRLDENKTMYAHWRSQARSNPSVKAALEAAVGQLGPAWEMGRDVLIRTGDQILGSELRGELQALMEKELPEGYDESTNYEQPLPQGDARRVLALLDHCTQLGLKCEAVVNRLVKPVEWTRASRIEELDTSSYSWVADRVLRREVVEAVDRQLRLVWLPRIGDSPAEAAWLASKFEQVAKVLGNDAVYAAAQAYGVSLNQAKKPDPEQFALGWLYFSQAEYRVGTPVRALEILDRAREWAPGLGDDPYDYSLELALNVGDRPRVERIARTLLSKSNQEIEESAPALLYMLPEVWTGAYGVTAEPARLADLVTRIEKATGALPPELEAYAPQRPQPEPGSVEWTERLVKLSFALRDEKAPLFVQEAAWRLVQKDFEYLQNAPAEALVIPFCVLDLLANDRAYAPAKSRWSELSTRTDPEIVARLRCGVWHVVEPFQGADYLVEHHKEGRAWAVRAFELWVLQDKLPAYAVRDSYLAEVPAFRTPVVEAWLKTH